MTRLVFLELMLSDCESMKCEICVTDYIKSSTTGLACGHLFCPDCWQAHMTTKIMQDGEADRIPCPAFRCPILVDDDMVLRMIRDPVVQSKYRRLMANNFVNQSKRLQWCPSPRCDRVVEVPEALKMLTPSAQRTNVDCSCGRSFCFVCSHEPHAPLHCLNVTKSESKCEDKDHTETTNNICSNTKDCLMCQVVIEKNGRCSEKQAMVEELKMRIDDLKYDCLEEVIKRLPLIDVYKCKLVRKEWHVCEAVDRILRTRQTLVMDMDDSKGRPDKADIGLKWLLDKRWMERLQQLVRLNKDSRY